MNIDMIDTFPSFRLPCVGR